MPPDLISYNSAIDACGKGGRWVKRKRSSALDCRGKGGRWEGEENTRGSYFAPPRRARFRRFVSLSSLCCLLLFFCVCVCVCLVGRLLVQLGVWSCLSFVTVRDRCDRSGVVEVRVFTAEFLTQPELLVVTDKETTYVRTLDNKGPYRPQTVGSRHTLLTTPYLKGGAILNEATSPPP